MSEQNLKAALEYAVKLREEQDVIYESDGKKYFDRSKVDLAELEPVKYAKPLVVNSLTGLVDYLKSDTDTRAEKLFIHVESPTLVHVYSPLDKNRKRELLIAAEAMLDKFPYRRFQDSESFIINIQSLFARDLDSEAILKCASSIRIEGGGDLVDNGVTQQVTVKKGAGTLSRAEVPSPAMLRPFRTFLEIEQPESPFIFRIDKDGDCALFEADGGLWKHAAMEDIAVYLGNELEEQVRQGRLTIIS